MRNLFNTSPRRKPYHHIPPCGGLHSAFYEHYCNDCLRLEFRKDWLAEVRRGNDLKEAELDLGPQQRREPRYIPQPTVEAKPTIQRRGA